MVGADRVPAARCPIPGLDIAMPGPAAPDIPPGEVRQEWLDHDGRLVASGGRHGDTWWMHWRGLATFWFGDAGPVRAEPVRHGLGEELHDIFVRGVVPVVLLAREFEGLHASAVLGPAGIVALCASSGTGKSTLALALASAGARHYADDTVIYRVIGNRPVAVSLPFPVRVVAAARQVVAPPLASGASTVKPTESAPFHRIYHLVRDAGLDPARPAFAVVPASRRFELLLAHAHPFDMGGSDRRRDFMERLLVLARSVEVWECRFAPDLAALPALASSIRAHAAGA